MAGPTRWFNYLRRECVSDGHSGTNPAWWLYHRSLARSSTHNWYLLVNEWIAANLGWYLRLPIPPFALMRSSSKAQRLFASLDYSGRDTQPDDMDPHALASFMPNECVEVLLFDILIANPDRHEGNLKVDDVSAPSRIEVIDHDAALFGRSQRSKGAERLGRLLGTRSLGLWPGAAEQHPPTHKLLGAISRADAMAGAIQRITDMPDDFIERVCRECADLGPTKSEIDAVITFLIDRKQRFLEILKDNKPYFSSVALWPLLLDN